MRLRITFSKSGTLRYTGHLDLHRIWERTCRRAGIPLSYSQGFHPQPRISLAAALPLGFIGMAELLDLWIDKEENPNDILEQLQNAAPPGLVLESIQVISEHQPALQTMVQFADYEVDFLDPMDTDVLLSKIEKILTENSIPRLRRSKNYDLRPLIKSLEINQKKVDQPVQLFMRMSASPAATGRPEEVLSEMDIRSEDTRITRTQLILQTQ